MPRQGVDTEKPTGVERILRPSNSKSQARQRAQPCRRHSREPLLTEVERLLERLADFGA
jgi:hypothetical protein